MSIIDRISPTNRSNRKAFLIGVGSLIDLRGIATYEAMQDLMPDPELTPLGRIYSEDERGSGSPEFIERVASVVLARIEQHQHIHLPEQAPDAAQLEELKRRAPEAYQLWIETTRKRVDHDIWRSKKATRQPYLLASLGQWLGLMAVLAVLVLAGFAVHYGHGVVAGVLGVVDIIGLAAVFNGNQGRRRDRPPPSVPNPTPES